MSVSVVHRRRLPGVSAVRVRADARHLLRALDEAGAELTVSLVDNGVIHHLNRDYRGQDRPTDVLAFAMREGARAPGDTAVVGDVVFRSTPPRDRHGGAGCSTADEVRTLLIHGVLHLLGYDHERSVLEARRMKAMARRLRAVLVCGKPSTSTRGDEGERTATGRDRP